MYTHIRSLVVAVMSQRKLSSQEVFFYVPNLIGYGRVVLAAAAFLLISHPRPFLALYAASCLLDVADGHLARQLGQCSRFGAVLDMVTDRSTTAGLLAHLCLLWPTWQALWMLLIGLDLSSHYMHMYASLSSGAHSHKNVSK